MTIEDLITYLECRPKDTMVKVRTKTSIETGEDVFRYPILRYEEEDKTIYIY